MTFVEGIENADEDSVRVALFLGLGSANLHRHLSAAQTYPIADSHHHSSNLSLPGCQTQTRDGLESWSETGQKLGQWQRARMNELGDGGACAPGLHAPKAEALTSEMESLAHRKQTSPIHRGDSQREHLQSETQRPCSKTATRAGRLLHVGTGLDGREQQSGLALTWALAEVVPRGTSLRCGRDMTSALDTEYRMDPFDEVRDSLVGQVGLGGRTYFVLALVEDILAGWTWFPQELIDDILAGRICFVPALIEDILAGLVCFQLASIEGSLVR